MQNFAFPLTAINIDGSTILLATVDDFNAFDRTHTVSKKHLYRRYRTDYGANDLPILVEYTLTYEWIVRDEFGRIVPAHAFDDPDWRRQRRLRLRKIRGKHTFRFDPVPGCRRSKYRRHHAPHKKNGGIGVRLRIEAFHSHDPRSELR